MLTLLSYFGLEIFVVMEQKRSELEQGPRVPEGIEPGLAEFIQRQIDAEIQAALPHLVRKIAEQIAERATTIPLQTPPPVTVGTTDRDQPDLERYDDHGVAEKESKVAA